MSDPAAEDFMLATAQALGLSPRQRREVMDQMQAASNRIESDQKSAEPSSCCAACDRFGDDGDPTARGCGLPDCPCHSPVDPWPDTEDAAAAHYAACNPEPADPSDAERQRVYESMRRVDDELERQDPHADEQSDCGGWEDH